MAEVQGFQQRLSIAASRLGRASSSSQPMVVDEDEAEDEEMSSEEKEDLLDYDGTLVYSFKDEARKKLGIDQLPKAEREYVLAQTDNLSLPRWTRVQQAMDGGGQCLRSERQALQQGSRRGC